MKIFCSMQRLWFAALTGFASLVGAQREPLPASAAPCGRCRCGDTDLTPFRDHDGGVFHTPADKNGYTYVFSVCDDLVDALPVGCQSGEHPAVVRFREADPSDCTVLGSFGPCELGVECGMSFEAVAATDTRGAGLNVFWQYERGCQNTFQVFLTEGNETEPPRVPFNDPRDPFSCFWTTTWQSLGAFGSVNGSTETATDAELELPTGVGATFALLFCYVCWVIFTVMMIVYACGIPDRSQPTPLIDVDESRPASQQRPAIERALRFHQLPRWQRRLITFQWATCGNVLFIFASLVYVAASVLNFQLSYFDVAWVGDYFFYDKINLCGAVIFTIEPLIDVAGAVAATWFTTCDQAHWETFGRKKLSDPDADTAASVSVEDAPQDTAENPLSASGNADDSSVGAESVTAGLECTQGSGLWWLRAPIDVQPWWKRWQWQGYVVWEKVPTTWELLLQDLNLYAALFFFLASLGYLWGAALPWMYAPKHAPAHGAHL